MNSRLFYFRKLLCATRFRGFECDRDISPIVNASLQHPSPHGSESQSDYDPFNGTGQNEPDIESENERGRRARDFSPVVRLLGAPTNVPS